MFKSGFNILKWEGFFSGEKKLVQILTTSFKIGTRLSLVTENNQIQHAIISVRKCQQRPTTVNLAFGVILGVPLSTFSWHSFPVTKHTLLKMTEAKSAIQPQKSAIQP